MATTLTTHSKMIQQTFDWENTADELMGNHLIGNHLIGNHLINHNLIDDNLIDNGPASNFAAAALAVAEPASRATAPRQSVTRKPASQQPRKSTKPVTSASSPSIQTLRRNRCEHVGGVMATVLSKYGLGLDDLLHTIDNLRMARSQATRTSQQ